jgi:hypothetical protein
VELGPALQDIYNYSQSLEVASSAESLSHITGFGDRMRLEASYAAKELADIHGIIGPMFHKVRPPISLRMFRDEPSIYQVTMLLPTYIKYVGALLIANRCTILTVVTCHFKTRRVQAHLRAIHDTTTPHHRQTSNAKIYFYRLMICR